MALSQNPGVQPPGYGLEPYIYIYILSVMYYVLYAIPHYIIPQYTRVRDLGPPISMEAALRLSESSGPAELTGMAKDELAA